MLRHLLLSCFACTSFEDIRQGQQTDTQEKIQTLLQERFGLLPQNQRDAYQARLLTAIGALPHDPLVLKRVLEHIDSVAGRATQVLQSLDKFRKTAENYPGARNLVLPDEYYFSAYQIAVERLEADLGRISKGSRLSPAANIQIQSQLDRLLSDTERILAQRLQPGVALERATSKAGEIIAEFKGIVDDPIYGFNRLLSEDEYETVVASLRDRIDKLPVLLLQTRDKTELSDPEGPFGPLLKPADKETQVVTDKGRAELLLTEALEQIYLFTRYNRPDAFAAMDRLKSLESGARSWVSNSRKTNASTIRDVLGKNVRSAVGKSEAENKKTVKMDTVPIPPNEPAAPRSALGGSPAESPKDQVVEKPTSVGRRWAPAVAIFLALAIVALAGLYRMRSQKRTAD